MRCSTYPARPPADVKFAGFRKNGHPRAADTAPNAMNARRPNALQFGRFIELPKFAADRYALAPDAVSSVRSSPALVRPGTMRPKKQMGSTGFEPVTFAV